jgi:hypothetical protein
MDSNKVLNLTPHDVHVFVAGATEPITFRATGVEARLLYDAQRELFRLNNGVPVWTPQKFNGIQLNGELDERNVDTVLVSMPVGHHLCLNRGRFRPHGKRFRVCGPDTSPDAVMRDGAGRITGTRRLVLYCSPPEEPQQQQQQQPQSSSSGGMGGKE